jgi:tRNA(Ile)-lysidine synthase
MKNDVTCRSVPTPQALAGMPGNTPVLLALSGGADSRALLHLLVAQRRECDFPLLLAHVDHGIRGSEAARDRWSRRRRSNPM